jgi:hypothetical protein
LKNDIERSRSFTGRFTKIFLVMACSLSIESALRLSVVTSR